MSMRRDFLTKIHQMARKGVSMGSGQVLRLVIKPDSSIRSSHHREDKWSCHREFCNINLERPARVKAVKAALGQAKWIKAEKQASYSLIHNETSPKCNTSRFCFGR